MKGECSTSARVVMEKKWVNANMRKNGKVNVVQNSYLGHSISFGAFGTSSRCIWNSILKVTKSANEHRHNHRHVGRCETSPPALLSSVRFFQEFSIIYSFPSIVPPSHSVPFRTSRCSMNISSFLRTCPLDPVSLFGHFMLGVCVGKKPETKWSAWWMGYLF